MAEPVRRGWKAMSEPQQSRVFQFGTALVTIIVTLGGIVLGYSRIQADTERLIARIEVRLESQAARIAALEGSKMILDAALSSDRLITERRVSSLEAFYSQVQATLLEIKSDLRLVRDRDVPMNRMPPR